MNFPRLLACLAASLLLSACGAPPRAPASPAVFSTGFESGSLGLVQAVDEASWQLRLRNDNDDPSLPDSFRTWFHFGLDGYAPGTPLTLRVSGFGARYPFVPVYSYDQVHWRHFDEAELAWHPCSRQTLDDCELTIRKAFERPQVWIARFFPYGTQDLDRFLATHAASPYLAIRTLALSPAERRPIQLLTIADPPPAGRVADDRRYVWIQARTHPAETTSSFVLEGLIERLLADDDLGRALRSRYVFEIVPMHNVDGIVRGNYRSNAYSENLEERWTFDVRGEPLPEEAPVPAENLALMQSAIQPLLRAGARFSLAINLHASNERPDKPAFFVPHFGDDPAVYSEPQRRLWQRHAELIALTSSHYEGRIKPVAPGGAGFLERFYPERWWWMVGQDAVNAITFETTYGRAGFDHWIGPVELRRVGDALARAIGDLRDDGASAAPAETLPLGPDPAGL